MKNIKKLVLLFIACIIANNTNFSYIGPFTTIKMLKEKKVFLVKDVNGKKFVIKRHYGQKSVLFEKLAYEMGKGIVNIPYTEIISFGNPLDMQYTEGLSTLHTFVEGEHENKNLIFQAITEDSHLKNIACHDESLAKIAAFNMYINNCDCHKLNLLRDNNNYFHVIDMGYAFNNPMNLAHKTYCYLESLNKDQLSMNEINALKVFDSTLRQLMKKYPSKVSSDMCADIAKKNGCVEFNMDSFFNDQYKTSQLVRLEIKRLIEQEINIVLLGLINPSKEAQESFWQMSIL